MTRSYQITKSHHMTESHITESHHITKGHHITKNHHITKVVTSYALDASFLWNGSKVVLQPVHYFDARNYGDGGGDVEL